VGKKVFTPKGINPAVWRAHKTALRAQARRLADEQKERAFEVLTAKPEERPEGLPPAAGISWPDKSGNLVPPVGDLAKQAHKGARAKPGAGARDKFDDAYQAMKTVDVTAFNFQAEQHFVWWLKRAIAAAEFECVGLAWCYQNGAYDLKLSTETVKRYVVKHTADRAEFVSRDGLLFIREKDG
jgi:hypothetical protein